MGVEFVLQEFPCYQNIFLELRASPMLHSGLGNKE